MVRTQSLRPRSLSCSLIAQTERALVEDQALRWSDRQVISENDSPFARFQLSAFAISAFKIWLTPDT